MALYEDLPKPVDTEMDYVHITAAGTALAKTGPGVLRSVNINTTGTGVTITLYDGIDASGAVIAAIDGSSFPVTFVYDVKFATGLFISVAATSALDATVSFR